MTFKQTHNLGFLLFCVLFSGTCAVSLLTLQKVKKVISSSIIKQEKELDLWLEMRDGLIDVSNQFDIIVINRTGSVIPLISGLKRVESILDEIADSYPVHKAKIAEIKAVLKKEKSSLYAYAQEIKEGYSSISTVEMEMIAFEMVHKVMHIASNAVTAVRRNIQSENKALIKNVTDKEKLFMLILIAAGIFISLYFLLLIGMLTKPVSLISDAMERVGKGDLNYRMKDFSDPYLDRMVFTFNKMTSDLAQAQSNLQNLQVYLVQAEKMSSIGQLAGGVAHEINNPLTGVLNNAQLIKLMLKDSGGCDFTQFKELVDVIEESALRCKRIVSSLLEFSHASTGEFRDINMNKTVEDVTMLIDNEMRLQNIALEKELDENIPLVKGDVQLLQQVVIGLLTNARWAVDKKFAQKAGGRIIIRTEKSADKFIDLYVIDNGIGIPEDKIKKIFEPFFTTKQVGEGTGMGLSLVFSIIQKHKGRISVDSQENKGAAFKVSLPYV